MKTREEIAQELADKKTSENLSEEVNQLKSLLSSFLRDFRKVSVKLEHHYKLEDEVALKELKTAIDSVPSEIVINNKHTTDKVSTKFLWWYFIASTVVIMLSVGYGVNQEHKFKDVEALEKKAFLKGKNEGFKEVFGTLPKSSQDFLKKKHPNVFQ